MRAPVGVVLVLLAVVLAAPAPAATPTPDPPPAAVAPEPPPLARSEPAPVRRAPVSTPAPAVPRRPVATTPAPAPTQVAAAGPKQKPAARRPVVAKKQPAAAVAPVRSEPHDRSRVPLAAFVGDELPDRGLLLLAGGALLLVALGGAVVLAAARRQLLLSALCLLALVAPAQAAPAPVSYTLVGTAGANGWHTSNVTIRWVVESQDLLSAPSCPAAELVTAEGTTSRQCTATFTWGTVTSPVVTIKIDKSAPLNVTGALTRAPDSDGWFNRPVSASFTGQDTVSGIAGCSAPTYAGADSDAAALSGTCTDVAGNASTGSVAFKYDATAPVVTPAPDRAPDARGWYRKPLTVSFAGSDLTSGIASCTAPVRYAGPDLAQAAVVGSCRDRAGNVAEGGYAFPYDATAPRLARVKAQVGKGLARIDWERAEDVVRVELLRSPGINGARRTVVYEGNGAGFVDRTVKPGVRYRYELSVADLAGNVASKAVTALERAALYSPAAGAVVRKPPLLRWRAVRGATFYNVQLYRNGVKVLSTWPKAASLRLARTWTYAGTRRRLEPGRYRWYVWGARGPREQPRYGRALGSSTFVVGR